MLWSGPCGPRGLTVSHACDPRMQCELGIMNRAYAKTVKLNPVKPTQERCVEKPRAAAAAAAAALITGEVRSKGGFGHADYCNFVNFYF